MTPRTPQRDLIRIPLAWRALVRLLPRDFRARYGAAVADFHRDRLAEARHSGESRFRVWRRASADLLALAVVEWGRVLAARPSLRTVSSPTPRLSAEDRMSIIVQEAAQAVRSLRRSVAFTAAAIVTLALGIGSTTAIFSVVRSVLLAPLPFPDADRVVEPDARKLGTNETWSVTYADFMDWRDQHVFSQVAVYQPANMDLTGPSDPVRVSAAAVSPQFFAALGVRQQLGRPLQAADYALDGGYAVVISDRLWRSQFGARPDIVGHVVEINAIKRTIVGVMPADARWPIDADLWVPLRISSELDPDLQRRDNFIFEAIARLKPGATLASTGAEMATLAARVAAEHPDIRGGVTTIPVPVIQAMLGSTTPRALWLLLGAVTLLLLIGCVNVANLQLARAAARQREIAVRVALGASRWRLVRQSLVESGALGLAGGVLGVAIAIWLVKGIVAIAPHDVPRIATASLDRWALGFGLAISLGVSLVFGLAPAVHAVRQRDHLAMGEGGARTSVGRASARTRRTLVTVELALSVVLLVGAGLAVRSIARLRRVDTGFDRRNVLTASISVPGITYDTPEKVVGFLYQLRERLAAAPGIQAAGIASASPLGADGFYLGREMVAEGRDPSPANEVSINWNVATPGYFAALGVPLVAGRDFRLTDDTAAPPVMIVNQTFAKRMFGAENPIGRRAMSSRDEKVEREIIGVVGDVKYFAAADSTRALVWVPYAQRNAWHQGIITVRARGGGVNALAVVRRELHALDPNIALANVVTMDEALSRSMAGDRLVAMLLATFAGLALVLAAIGVFGVLSYAVAQRTREMGIRLALGARPKDVRRLVAGETAPMVCIGVAIGLAAAFGLARLARSMWYEVGPNDPVTFVGVAVVLGLVAVVAALVPARRAGRVDPVIAIRNE
ncbi:MAG TPA: ABC transporter permease [Gemmatimonadaceae bacterium]